MSGFEYTSDEFENFARSSESRKVQFDALKERLDAPSQLSGSPFGHMPWSGSLESAYDDARTALLAMTDSAAEVMQVIATNIRNTRDQYQAAEVENTSTIEKLGDE